MGKDSRSRKHDRGAKPELNPEQQALMKLAAELRGSKGIEHRTSVLEETRVEYFRGKDLARWLHEHADRVRDLPLATAPGGGRSPEERVFERMLAYNYLIQTDRVNKKIPKGRKKLPKWPNRDGLMHLPLKESKFFNEDTFYIWTFEQPTATWKTVLIVCCLPLLTIGCCLFPLSPMWMRHCVLYLCMAILGVMLGVVAVRFVAHLLVWIVLGKNFWILPNLLSEEVAITDAFRPLWGFHERTSGGSNSGGAKSGVSKGKAKDVAAKGAAFEDAADGSSTKGEDSNDDKDSDEDKNRPVDKGTKSIPGAKSKEGKGTESKNVGKSGTSGGHSKGKDEDTGSFLPSPSLVNRLAVLAVLVAIGYAVVRHGPDGNQVRQMRSKMSNSLQALLEWNPAFAQISGGGGKGEPPVANATVNQGGEGERAGDRGERERVDNADAEVEVDPLLGMDDVIAGDVGDEVEDRSGGGDGDGLSGEGSCEQRGQGEAGRCPGSLGEETKE